MSLSAAQRLLRPSPGLGPARHASLSHGLASASQRSESQRSDDSGLGPRSVRSSSTAAAPSKSLLFPSAAFAGAEHAALSKRVADHQALLLEQAATIKRLETKLDQSLEAQSQLRASLEHDLADVRGALPEMMRDLVAGLRQQMHEAARAQADDT
jgi:hypothetical protein